MVNRALIGSSLAAIQLGQGEGRRVTRGGQAGAEKPRVLPLIKLHCGSVTRRTLATLPTNSGKRLQITDGPTSNRRGIILTGAYGTPVLTRPARARAQ